MLNIDLAASRSIFLLCLELIGGGEFVAFPGHFLSGIFAPDDEFLTQAIAIIHTYIDPDQ